MGWQRGWGRWVSLGRSMVELASRAADMYGWTWVGFRSMEVMMYESCEVWAGCLTVIGAIVQRSALNFYSTRWRSYTRPKRVVLHAQFSNRRPRAISGSIWTLFGVTAEQIHLLNPGLGDLVPLSPRDNGLHEQLCIATKNGVDSSRARWNGRSLTLDT